MRCSNHCTIGHVTKDKKPASTTGSKIFDAALMPAVTTTNEAKAKKVGKGPPNPMRPGGEGAASVLMARTLPEGLGLLQVIPSAPGEDAMTDTVYELLYWPALPGRHPHRNLVSRGLRRKQSRTHNSFRRLRDGAGAGARPGKHRPSFSTPSPATRSSRGSTNCSPTRASSGVSCAAAGVTGSIAGRSAR